MSEYSFVKSSKLSFKGDSGGGHKKHKKRKSTTETSDVSDPKKKSSTGPDLKEIEDRQQHGGWAQLTTAELIRGNVAIEVSVPRCYMRALDNALMVVGPPHPSEEGPDQEEILIAVPTVGSLSSDKIGSSSSTTAESAKIALKTGYGKYICVDSAGRLRGTSDAIGPRELFEPVYQDGRCALLASNGKFLTVLEEDAKRDNIQEIKAFSDQAKESEMVRIRSLQVPSAEEQDLTKKSKGGLQEEDRPGVSLPEAELAYVKKFQSFHAGKLKVARSDFGEVKKARQEGNLHAAMLNRREKMKSDKFCK